MARHTAASSSSSSLSMDASSSRSATTHAPPSNAIAIPIPTRKKRVSVMNGTPGSSSSSGQSSSLGGGFGYGSFKSEASGSPSSSPNTAARRRESLMSETFSKADYTVINVGEEERPRLITCVKASQGFDWNQEIFLPSYANYHFDDLERRQDPVEEITVTDEEVQKMFPL